MLSLRSEIPAAITGKFPCPLLYERWLPGENMEVKELSQADTVVVSSQDGPKIQFFILGWITFFFFFLIVFSGLPYLKAISTIAICLKKGQLQQKNKKERDEVDRKSVV